uniref:ribonuclease H n=1 Tax=Knipowitschia caucasica TaxID=637954 RepID=A0AAV2K2P3_KNICA
MPGLYFSAAAIMDAPLPPQPIQRVEDFTSVGATTRGRRRIQPTLCPRMDPIVHYVTREWPKPLAAKRPALGYGMYCSGQDWSWTGGVPDVEDSVRMALHPSASVWPGTRPLLPSERDRMSLAMLDRCYANAAQVVALANNMAFITGVLDRSLSSGQALSGDLLSQARTTSAAILRMCQALAVNGGRSMAAAQVGARHLWLGLANQGGGEEAAAGPAHLPDVPMQALVARLESAANDSARLAPHLAPRREAHQPSRSRDRGRERSPGRRPDPYPRSVVHRPPSTRPPGPDRPTGGSREQRTHRRPPYGRGGRGGKNSFNKGRPGFHQYLLSESHLGVRNMSNVKSDCVTSRAHNVASLGLQPPEQGVQCATRATSSGPLIHAMPSQREVRRRDLVSSGVCASAERVLAPLSYKANTGFPTPGARPPLHEARARGGRSSRVTWHEQTRTYDVGPAGHVTAPGAHGMTQGAPLPFRLPPFPARNNRRGRGCDVSCSSSRSAPHRLLQHLEGAGLTDGSVAGEDIAQGLRTAILPKATAIPRRTGSTLSGTGVISGTTSGGLLSAESRRSSRGRPTGRHQGAVLPLPLGAKEVRRGASHFGSAFLNECISKRQFRMLSTKQLLECVRQGDWMSSIDLTDAYFHVPIVPEHRRFLRFAVGERSYEYCRFPFGYALPPRTFSKCVEAALEPLRRAGVRILTYIDDWLILASSREVAVSHTHWVLSHIQRLGFVVNREKSKLQPAQRMIYLGLQLHSVTFRAALSEDRRRNITRLAREVLAGPRVPARRLRSLLGMMAAAHAVGRLIWVPQVAASDIRFWLTLGLLRDGVTLACAVSHVEVFTDASLEGWGGVLGQSSVGGCWSDSARHINLLEMEAVHRVLLHFAPQLQGRHVMVRSDNTTVVSFLNRQGGTRSPALHRMATVTLLWAALHLLSLRARHVPGARNVGADRMSRGGPLQDEWGLAPRPPLGVDALAHYPWPGGLLYAFPPVRLLPVLLRRIEQERRSVILVAPDNPHARWFPFLRGMASIQGARAPSTVRAYATRWRLFSGWCGSRSWDPRRCPLEGVLGLLQELFDKGRAVTTLAVFAAAITSGHDGFGGFTARSHPLVKRFLRGARRRRPPLQRMPPVWDLRVVLRGLSGPPFEPAVGASPECFAFKTALLLALASAKRATCVRSPSMRLACPFERAMAGWSCGPIRLFSLRSSRRPSGRE